MAVSRSGEQFWRDVKFSLRSLSKYPGFTSISIITLALAIGANMAIFGILDRALLRPLPFHDSDQLVWISQYIPEIDMQLVTGSRYLQWYRENQVLVDVGAFHADESFNLTRPGEPSRIQVARISSSFLRTLGMVVSQGRDFTSVEDMPGRDSVAIVSRKLFNERFGSASDLAGKTLVLDDKNYVVVGVLPPTFQMFGHPDVQILVPLGLDSVEGVSNDQTTVVEVIGRLKAGIEPERARANLETLSQRVADGQSNNKSFVEVIRLKEHLTNKYRRTLYMLGCAAGLVLLIGCVNLATLLLGRLSTRRREFAVRGALGASAGQIARQILTECWLLSTLGGVFGVGVSIAGTKFSAAFLPPTMSQLVLPGAYDQLSLRLVGVSIVLVFVTSFLVSLIPVLVIFRSDVCEGIKETSRSGGQSARDNAIRRYLIVCEMALALILLNQAGLFSKSLYRLIMVDPGFISKNIVTFNMQLSAVKYPEYSQRFDLSERIIQSLSRLPGVDGVGISDSLPLSGNATELYALTPENSSLPISQEPQPVDLVYASPKYFRVMEIPLIRGRVFEESDLKDLHVAVVSKGLAKHFWGNQNVVGRRIKKGPVAPWSTIIGVVEDIHRSGLDQEKNLCLYQPWAASSMDGTISVSIRSGAGASIITREARKVVQTLDTELPIYDVATMDERLSDSVGPQRFNAFAVGVFTALAVALVAIGVYGLISFFVSRRMHEIGVRIALGATSRDILKLIFAEGLWLLPVAILLGLPISLFLGKSLSVLLFDVKPMDWSVVCMSVGVLCVTTALACLVPARRGIGADPIAILHYE